MMFTANYEKQILVVGTNAKTPFSPSICQHCFVVALLAGSAAGPPPEIIAATLWFTKVAPAFGAGSER
jgi:hypothetical protein